MLDKAKIIGLTEQTEIQRKLAGSFSFCCALLKLEAPPPLLHDSVRLVMTLFMDEVHFNIH